MSRVLALLRRVGRAARRPYQLVRDGQADLDAVYPEHPTKPSLEQAATQGLVRRKWFRRT